MTALAKDKIRDFVPAVEPVMASDPMRASSTVYVGSALSVDNAGRIRALNAGDEAFVGFSEQNRDNVTAGVLDARYRSKGIVILPIPSLALTDKGAAVYATTDNDFKLTSTSALAVGKIHRVIKVAVEATPGLAEVYFEGISVQSLDSDA